MAPGADGDVGGALAQEVPAACRGVFVEALGPANPGLLDYRAPVGLPRAVCAALERIGWRDIEQRDQRGFVLGVLLKR